jgi:diguanylate cyclase (GGDEF)-like protein
MSDLPERSSKISTHLVKIFTAVVVLTISLFGSLVWYTWDTFRYLDTTQKNYFRLTELSGSIVHLDEGLTMSARMAAATGEQTWEARYRGFETKLDAAIKEAMVLGQGFSLKDAADKTDTANLKLVDMENQVFDLVRKGQAEKAEAILSSAEYDVQKKAYISSIAQITETIRGNLEKDITEYQHRGYLAIGSIVIITPCLVLGWILVARLIRQYNTIRKQAEEALRSSNEMFSLYMHYSPIYTFIKEVTPTQSIVLQASDNYRQMIGVPGSEMAGKAMEDLFPAEFAAKITEDDWAVVSKGDVLKLDEELNDRSYTTIKFPIIQRDRTLLAGYTIDITDQKRAEEALRESENRYRELSIHDNLTQLYNSRHFYHQLKREIDRVNRYGQSLTFLLLDLDDFKAFNDTYGHVEGDQVLRRFGQVFKKCLRHTDSAYRYGGEEFTILMPMTTSEDGAVTAERIRTEFKKETFSQVPGQDIHVTVSIGLAQYKPQEGIKAFVQRVDQLMYKAKKNGKDRVCCES